jgi:hypothetical protein
MSEQASARFSLFAVIDFRHGSHGRGPNRLRASLYAESCGSTS